MSKPLTFVEPKMDIKEAARLMFSDRIEKLPVVENRRLVGVAPVADIALGEDS